MKLKQIAWAASALVVGASASAQTSTFVNNGGVHESAEYGSDTFQLPVTTILDKFTFSLASAVGLESDVVSLGRPPISGTVSLYADQAVDTLVGSYSFGTGSYSFGALTAGDYYYTVSATGSNGGGFTFGSYIVPVPEPETLALMVAGLGLLGFVSRRRRQG